MMKLEEQLHRERDMAAHERDSLSQKAHELQEKVSSLLKTRLKTSPRPQWQVNGRKGEEGMGVAKLLSEDQNGGYDSPASSRTPILELTARGVGSGALSPKIKSPLRPSTARSPGTLTYISMSQDSNMSPRDDYEQPIRDFSSRSSNKSPSQSATGR
jgi:hypothetical protein